MTDILKGFHEILDGQPSRLDYSPSLPLFLNGNRASYGLEGEGLWSDLIPDQQQPEEDDVVDTFMYDPASVYTVLSRYGPSHNHVIHDGP